MSLKLHEARTRADLLTDIRSVIHLDVSATDQYLVDATITFTCREPGAETFLELAGARDVVLNGQPADHDNDRIVLRDLAEHNTVRVLARMPYVTDGDGMTVTIDPADGERYVAAFTAMDVARKVIPCFDQPDLKTTFEVSVTAPEHWKVLANGPLARREGNTWHFETTPVISTYLFFMTGGPYVSRLWDEPNPASPGTPLAFGWHARASQEALLERDFEELKRITSACFQHYTTTFDPPYAFADYQSVFTPGLNWAAMEFPGCVAFRDEFLKQGTPTAMDRQWVASLIAHEMAHMWFGDLVTMRWWEDSWLNESFADFMGYDVADIAAGYGDAWTTAAIARKPTGYRADRRRSTHPVAEDADNLVDVDTAFANFDMITYAKGAAVLRQLGIWLGPETFLAGVNAHLTAHAFGNATLADFLRALDAATDQDVRGWADAWLRTTGHDTLVVTRDGDVPVITREGTRTHRITVGAYDHAMRLVDTTTIDLADEPRALDEFAGRVVVPNAGDETFAALRPDDQSWTAITTSLSSVESPLTRAMLWWTAIDLAESRVISVGSLMALAERHLRPEHHPIVFEGGLAAVRTVVRRYCEPSEVPAHLKTLADLTREVLRAGDPALAPAASLTFAAACNDPAELVGLLDRPDTDQPVRWATVKRLAELGDPSHIAAEVQRDKSVAGHHAALSAWAAIPTAEAKAEAWALLMSGDLGNHEFAAVAAGFWGIEQGVLLGAYVDRYVPEALDLAHRSGQAMGKVIGEAFPVLPLAKEDRERLRDQLAAALEEDVPTVLARSWNDSLDDLDRTI